MRLDYNKRVIDALAKALGKTSEQVERILIDSGVMRPNIPLEPFENGWYISHDREWMLYKRGEDRWESVRYNVCGSMSIGATDWEKTGEFIGGPATPIRTWTIGLANAYGKQPKPLTPKTWWTSFTSWVFFYRRRQSIEC